MGELLPRKTTVFESARADTGIIAYRRDCIVQSRRSLIQKKLDPRFSSETYSSVFFLPGLYRFLQLRKCIAKSIFLINARCYSSYFV